MIGNSKEKSHIWDSERFLVPSFRKHCVSDVCTVQVQGIERQVKRARAFDLSLTGEVVNEQ